MAPSSVEHAAGQDAAAQEPCAVCGRLPNGRGARDCRGVWLSERAIAAMPREVRVRAFGAPVPLVAPIPPCPACAPSPAPGPEWSRRSRRARAALA